MFFVAVSEEKLLQNNQSLWNFCFWSCKEAALLLVRHNFLFYAEKISDYVDADVSKLYRSVSQHPVKCDVKREKDISHNCLMHD